MIYPTITGLDIGHHSIKAVSARLKKGQLELIDSHEVLLPESAFLDVNTLHIEEVIPYLGHLKKGIKRNQKKVAFSIPDNSIMSKVIQVDSQLDEKETEFTVIHTFEQQTPFLAEELNIDFVAMEQKGVNSEQISMYQVFAAKKDLVESREGCLKRTGFLPVLAEVHSHALLTLWRQSITQSPSKKNWMLIDIGHCQTTFCITSPNQHAYSKQVLFGASHQKSGIELSPLTPLNEEKYTQFIALLAEHIHRQLTLYSSIHNHKVDGVWLTGGGSMLPELSDLLSYELSLPTEQLNIMSLFHGTKRREAQLNTLENQYALAAGLALRGVEWLTK